MRARLLIIGIGVGIGCLAMAPGRAAAQQASASGAVGAGVFGTEAAASASLGLEVTGDAYAVGLGARLRWVAADGLRTEDWDEPSEWASVLRYLLYTRAPADGVRASAAVGALGGVDLGHGAVLRGYTTGLDVDHHRLGAQVHVEGARYGAEALVDDLVTPRVAAARAYWQRPARTHTFETGLSLAADFDAPAMAGATVLPMAVLDGRAELHTHDRRLVGALHTDLVAIGTLAAGVHLGLSGQAAVRDARLRAGVELQVGTERYIPGWIGPLYERDRRALGGPMSTQLDVARAGDLGRLGGTIEAGASHPGLGELELSYASRPGLPDLAVARVAAPYFRDVQGALWAALERAGSARVLALELRAALPRGLFMTVEAARLFREQDGALAPWWQATAALGASLGVGASTSPR